MTRQARNRRWLALFAGSALAGACSTGGGLTRSTPRQAAESPTGGSAVSPTGDLDLYLETMRQIIEGDPLEAAATLRRVEEAADIAPTTTNRLTYALILGLPGHAGSDAAEAQRRLNALLASSDALLPAERLLATIRLQDVEQRLILEVAAADLRRELAEASRSNDAESQRRIQSLIDENRRLQTALDEATAKLNAITSIEQSILELDDGAN